MGLMLMEIGLGLHGLALLHLLAHAVYKAYAFLTSGESVRSSKIDLMPSSEPHIITTVWISAAAVMSAGTVVAGSAGLWAKVAGFDPPAAVALILLCFGLSPRWWQPLQGRRGLRHALLMTIGAAQLYLAWHALLGLTGFHDQATVNPVTSAAAVLMIALVYAASALIALRRSAATVLYRWAYAGFYLDERITRLTFRLFPPLTQQESRLHTAATTEISP
jgi:NAD(P)H-quinone oxidoreductase subunit 5